MQGITDTAPEIAEMIRVRLMALSGAERFLMGVRMFEAARRMALASLPANFSEPERKRLLFERFYGMPLPIQKSKEYRRAGAGGTDLPQARPKGEDTGKQPNQFVEKGAEVYAEA